MVNSCRDTNAVLGTKQEQIRVNRAYKQALEPNGGRPIHPLGTTEFLTANPPMLSVIIPTRNSERALVPTLSAL
ncbi:MAG: hypothetical protein WBD71_15120, partial [Xanthobacteraceae bacterium]